jgi:hypothetical protein
MVSKLQLPSFVRPQADDLTARLQEPRRFLQVVAGARQVGKTTLVRQVLARLDRPHVLVSADEPTLQDAAWLRAQWDAARLAAKDFGAKGAILAVDEVQKVQGWSEAVKRLWDEDSASGVPLRVVLLGSAPLLLTRGLSESLAGRFEQMRLPHWSLREMRAAFGFDLEAFLYFGGYPGAARLASEPERWRRYVLDALVETTIARDVLLLARLDKPALLRRVFELGCRYSGQILSYNKMLGQLQDAGNTVTLAHYLELLGSVGMLSGLSKFAGEAVRSRASSPKLQVLNTALMTAVSGLSPTDSRADGAFWGRLVESAVGAHLANAAACGECELFYWRDRGREVDFVVRRGKDLAAIEVKSGTAAGGARPGLQAFERAFGSCRALVVGGDGIPVEDFLARPASHWVGN